MDDLTRAVGKLEGRFDGLEKSLDDGLREIRVLLTKHVLDDEKVEKRVGRLENQYARAMGFVAAISAAAGVVSSLVIKRIA